MAVKDGDIFNVPYPFVRCKAEVCGDEGPPITIDSWRPGVEFDTEEGYYGSRTTAAADAMGLMHLSVVSVHKPGKYPERVFYVRTFTTPDGKKFGKTRLRMTTTPAFMRLTRGFRVEFELCDDGASQ